MLFTSAMDQTDDTELDPHEEIARLEARIEYLAARIQGCRKFRLPSRIAIATGAVLLIAMMVRAIPFNATLMVFSIVAVLGGLILLGTNASTANEAAAQLAAAEVRRAELIGLIGLRLVEPPPTLH